MNFVKNISAEELNKEIKGKKCSFNYIKCPCINRIISILSFYQKWLLKQQQVIDDDDDDDKISPIVNQHAFDLAVYQKEIYGNNGPLLRLESKKTNIMTETELYKLGIYDFINEVLDNYSNILLLNDFNHILYYHCNQHNEIEEICKNIVRKFITNNSECSLMECLCIKRNHRNKTLQNENGLYFVDNNDDQIKEIVTQQILDKIHCFYQHTFDIGYRLNSNERLKINQVQNEEIAQNKSVLYNQTLFNKHQHHKQIMILNGNKASSHKHNQLYSTNDESTINNKMYSFGFKFKYQDDDEKDYWMNYRMK